MDEDPMRAIDITCPTCGSPSGVPCHIPGVASRDVMHGTRIPGYKPSPEQQAWLEKHATIRAAGEIANTSAIAALTAERDQLQRAYTRTLNETGARLRVLMAITMISKEAFENMPDEVQANQALLKMKPLLAALEMLPPLTAVGAPTGITITIPPELVESIEGYLAGHWDDPKDEPNGTQLAALNAVAFIGERLIGLYTLTKEAK